MGSVSTNYFPKNNESRYPSAQEAHPEYCKMCILNDILYHKLDTICTVCFVIVIVVRDSFALWFIMQVIQFLVRPVYIQVISVHLKVL